VSTVPPSSPACPPGTVPLRPPRAQGTVRLRDGRQLGFAEYGVPDGKPILWLHGTPGGRQQVPPKARAMAASAGVRLVGVERPGAGWSTPHLHENVLGFADDVLDLVDALGIGRFALVGLSGGGPYVLACAHRLPERVIAGALLGGVAPAKGPDAIAGGAAALAVLGRPLLEVLRVPLGCILSRAIGAIRPVAWHLAPPAIRSLLTAEDARVICEPLMMEVFVGDIIEAARHHLQAPVCDGVLFGREWGFALRDVRVPIRLWHGDADPLVPLSHAEHLAARLPDTALRVRHGESHVGSLGAADEVLATLLDLWPEDDRGSAGAAPREPAAGASAPRSDFI
jgi:pimeloyl-ACP methyl ester carboxylesterase